MFSCYSLHVEPADRDDAVIKFSGVEVRTKRLVRKTGKTEIGLEIGQQHYDREWEWAVHALVDISCRQVYGFKVILKAGNNVPVKRLGCVGYVLCLSYGDVVPNKSRPISCATEIAKLTLMEPYAMPEYMDAMGLTLEWR